MLGISYGELFLLLGATAALIGPKDLPIIARTAGRLAGRAIGYVQVARGQFESVMQQSQARQVHKELQDTMAQLKAIRHEIRSISFMNPGTLTTRLVDNISSQSPVSNVDKESLNPLDGTVKVESKEATTVAKNYSSTTLSLSDMHSQASTFARLAESTPLTLSDVHSQASPFAGLAESAPLTPDSMDEVLNELKDESVQFIVLPVSAESAKLLPSGKGELRGSDILLEAVLEEDVAHNAKGFFSQAQTQIKSE